MSEDASSDAPKIAVFMRQPSYPRMLFVPPQAPGLPLAFRTVIELGQRK